MSAEELRTADEEVIVVEELCGSELCLVLSVDLYEFLLLDSDLFGTGLLCGYFLWADSVGLLVRDPAAGDVRLDIEIEAFDDSL